MKQNVTFRETVRAIDAEAIAGDFAASVLLKLPVEDWLHVLMSEPAWCRLGTFEMLLRAAHDELDVSPRRSLAITAFVLSAFDRAPSRAPLRVARLRVRGIAWKEHANALWSLGRYDEAAEAISRALAIFAPDLFALDRAVATMVAAMIDNATGRSAQALQLLDGCERTFVSCRALRHELQVLQLRGYFLFDLHRYDQARSTWLRAEDAAQRLGDQRDWTRIQHNLGACAVEANEMGLAQEYFVLAAERFSRLGMATEALRSRGRLAELPLIFGCPTTAVAELDPTREAFCALEMRAEVERIQELKDGVRRS